MTKLHLGCGQRYLEGYVNIDFPQKEHTVQQNVVADRHEDLIKLVYPDNSVKEIRLHHVFEHFPRTTALALLCRWRDFLKPDGLLRIETPDAMACFQLMTLSSLKFQEEQQVIRHLFGSHEAKWAFHLDGWYKEKFEYVLDRIGFCNLQFKTNEYGVLRNIEVFAYKSEKSLDINDYHTSVHEILMMSTIKEKGGDLIPQGSELDMLGLWKNEWKRIYTAS